MIQAYHIERFYECKLTGNCLVEVSFAGKKGPKTFVHPISNYQHAVSYIDREARDWFLQALENFVNHKKHIITDDTHPQWKSLKVCENALIHYEKMATNTICEKFLKGHSHFIGILPHPHNNSYESSEHDLKELKRFCEEFLKFKPLSHE